MTQKFCETWNKTESISCEHKVCLNPKLWLKPVNTKFAYLLSPDFLFSASPEFVYTRETSIFFLKFAWENFILLCYSWCLHVFFHRLNLLSSYVYRRIWLQVCNGLPSPSSCIFLGASSDIFLFLGKGFLLYILRWHVFSHKDLLIWNIKTYNINISRSLWPLQSWPLCGLKFDDTLQSQEAHWSNQLIFLFLYCYLNFRT